MARRTVGALWDAIGIALDDFSPEECFNYFRNAGYGSHLSHLIRKRSSIYKRALRFADLVPNANLGKK
jgi:hypothetical protein